MKRFPTLLVIVSTFSILNVAHSSLAAKREEQGTRRQQDIEREVKKERFDAKPWEVTEPYGWTYSTADRRGTPPSYNFLFWMADAQKRIQNATKELHFRQEETVELTLGAAEELGQARIVVTPGNEELSAAVLAKLTKVGVPPPPQWYRGPILRFFATIQTNGSVKLSLPADSQFYEQVAFSIVSANWHPPHQPATRPAFDLIVTSEGRVIECKKVASSPDAEFDKQAQEWLSRRIFPPFLDQHHNGKSTLKIHVDLEKLELSPSHAPVES